MSSFFFYRRKLVKITEINHIDKPDKLHLAGRVNRAAATRYEVKPSGESSGEGKEREREAAERRAEDESQPSSGCRQIARARLLPG